MKGISIKVLIRMILVILRSLKTYQYFIIKIYMQNIIAMKERL